jgi:hypothetical protein
VGKRYLCINSTPARATGRARAGVPKHTGACRSVPKRRIDVEEGRRKAMRRRGLYSDCSHPGHPHVNWSHISTCDDRGNRGASGEDHLGEGHLGEAAHLGSDVTCAFGPGLVRHRGRALPLLSRRRRRAAVPAKRRGSGDMAVGAASIAAPWKRSSDRPTACGSRSPRSPVRLDPG